MQGAAKRRILAVFKRAATPSRGRGRASLGHARRGRSGTLRGFQTHQTAGGDELRSATPVAGGLEPFEGSRHTRQPAGTSFARPRPSREVWNPSRVPDTPDGPPPPATRCLEGYRDRLLGALLIGALGACSNAKVLSGASDSGVGSRAEAGDGPGVQINLDSGSGIQCPSTCAELDADCGGVTDTKCGGLVNCGTCDDGMVCGVLTHNVCGRGANPNADACEPQSCKDQGLSCGPTSNGCNETLWCGFCSAPQMRGGDPKKPGQCGCTGLCSQVPSCDVGKTTTITGQVYDPAGLHPLFDALVYIPNDPTDPGLKPFPAGITCDVCGATAAGNPLITARTDVNGNFTLTNVPTGTSIPLVVQLGRWRRQFTANVTKSCAPNPLPGKLTMPKSHTEGDIPRIAILTGAVDPVECTLRKMGIADSEFSNPGAGGRINFFVANGDGAVGTGGPGAAIDKNTPTQTTLFATNGSERVINQYDLLILECEGYAERESDADLAAIRAYANAGGRVFGSDFNVAWFRTNGDFAKAADWTPGPYLGGVAMTPVNIDVVSNPKGESFSRWLEVVGVSMVDSHAIASLFPVYNNTTAVVSPTQQWLYGNNRPVHFTFNMPVGAPSVNQCGRVVMVWPRRHSPRSTT